MDGFGGRARENNITITDSESLEYDGPLLTNFTICVCTYVVLLLCAGIASGLTIGLMSIDPLKLKVMSLTGSKFERKYSRSLIPILRHPNFLLVSLLLANAACVESMPIFLDRISNPTIAIVVSVTSVLIFGEVLPQAFFKRYSVQLGYYLLPFIYLTLFVTSPISWPVGALISLCLKGDKNGLFTRSELSVLLKMHGPSQSKCSKNNGDEHVIENIDFKKELEDKEALVFETKSSCINACFKRYKYHTEKKSTEKKDQSRPQLSDDEVHIMINTMTLGTLRASDAMLTLDKTCMVSTDRKIDMALMNEISASGFSRIPVYGGHDHTKIRGVILTKKLLTLHLDKVDCSLGNFIATMKPAWFEGILYVSDGIRLMDLLKVFRSQKHGKIAVVTNHVELQVNSLLKSQYFDVELRMGNIDAMHPLFFLSRLHHGGNTRTMPMRCLPSQPQNPDEIQAIGVVWMERIVRKLLYLAPED